MTPIHLRENFFATQLPEGSQDIGIRSSMDNERLLWFDHRGAGDFIDLPPGSWEIVCLSKEVTEEVALKLVEAKYDEVVKMDMFPLYVADDAYCDNLFLSLEGLLRSKGLDPHKTLILKKTA